MANPEFLELATYANAVEAEHIRGVLEENDVPAFIDGAAANTALSYVGTAIGGVKVFVRAGDAKRARAIIEDVLDEPDIPASTWYCGTCRETIDGAFELCWSCGSPRSDVERLIPPITSAITAETIDPQAEINLDAEAMLLRAWRASIIGIVFLPIALHLFSMYLLICAATTATTFSPEGTRRFYAAFGVNVVAGCVWGVIMKLMF